MKYYHCEKCKEHFKNGKPIKQFEGKYYSLDCWNIGNPNQMETIEPLEDVINKPSHYHKGGIDVIGFAKAHYSVEEVKGFFRINIIKYVDRYEKKNGIEDLKKAANYLNMLMELDGK